MREGSQILTGGKQMHFRTASSLGCPGGNNQVLFWSPPWNVQLSRLSGKGGSYPQGTPGPGAMVREKQGWLPRGGGWAFPLHLPGWLPLTTRWAESLVSGQDIASLSWRPLQSEGCSVWGEDPLEVSLPQAHRPPAVQLGSAGPAGEHRAPHCCSPTWSLLP